MWPNPEHVRLERTPINGLIRFRCEHCDLGLDVRMTGKSLTDYEKHADDFILEHWHRNETPKPARRWISLD